MSVSWPLVVSVPLGESTMTECNHGRGFVIDLISSSTGDDDDCSLCGCSIDSDYDSFELGIDGHGRLTSMPS
jgi:hypothetical protein